MEVVAQLVRASDCGSEGRGFETRLPPQKIKPVVLLAFLFYNFPNVFSHNSSRNGGKVSFSQGCVAPKT